MLIIQSLTKDTVMNWDDLNLEKNLPFKPFAAYKQSKLANVLFSMELARRFQGKSFFSIIFLFTFLILKQNIFYYLKTTVL